MPEQAFFYLVFLSQVLLISYYIPSRVLRRVRHVVATYPPSQYPKLYPVSMDRVEQAQRNYRNMNLLALLVGLGLLLLGIYSPSDELLHWDSSSALTVYMAFQYSPFIIAATAGFTYFNLKRKTDSRSTRKAELRPRRLFDFVSRTMIGAAIFVYVAFALLVLYLRQFEFSWFGGYWNILGVTLLYLFFAGMIFRSLYGKKKDPYQAYEDRTRQIELRVRIAVFVSIAATSFIAISVILRAVGLPQFLPASQSLYFQLLALICFREFRIDNVNFDVYKEDPLVA